MPQVGGEVPKLDGEVAKRGAGVANRDAAVAQVQVDRQGPGGAVGDRPTGVHGSGRGRFRRGTVGARAGEALAQVVVHVLRAVTAAVGRLAHALVVRQVGHPHFAGYQLQSVNHLRKLGERLDTDGAFAVERLRYV